MKNKLFILLCLSILVNINLILQINKTFKASIIFIDVGQGDATLIKSGKSFGLIDTGRNSSISDTLDKYINTIEKEIEFVVLTHPDADHIQGLLSIIDSYKIKKIFLNKTLKTNLIIKKIYSKILEKNIKNYSLNDLNDFRFGSFYFNTLWPDELNQKNFSIDTNDLSISFLVTVKNQKIFLGGDLSYEIEDKLSDKIGNVDILKLSHHGSSTSTSLNFLEKTDPEKVVISAGENNSYGHPHKSVLESIKKVDSEIFETYAKGDIKFEF